MPQQGKIIKAVLLTIAFIEIFLFTSLTMIDLILLSIGIALVILTFFIEYKLIAMLGILILGTGVATSLEITSILEIRFIMTAIIGIFLPLFTIGVIILGPGEKLEIEKLKSKRHLYLTLAFICICILIVPMAAILMDLFSPSIALHLSAIIEIAILIVVMAILTIIMLTIRPRKAITETEDMEAE